MKGWGNQEKFTTYALNEFELLWKDKHKNKNYNTLM